MGVIDELLAIEEPRVIKISPDNQHVLYSTTPMSNNTPTDHHKSTLWIGKTGHANSSRQVTSGEYNDSLPQWNPDGNSFAFVSDRAKQGEQWAIYTLPASGEGEPSALTPTEHERSIDQFEFSPDGKYIAYISLDEKTEHQRTKEQAKDDAQVFGSDMLHNRLRLVEVATKSDTTLFNEDRHVIGFTFNDNGDQIAFLHTGKPGLEDILQNGARTSIIDLASNNIRHVTDLHPGWPRAPQWTGDTLYTIDYINTSSVLSSNAVFSLDLTDSNAKWQACAHGQENCASDLSKAGKDITVKVQDRLSDEIKILNGSTLFKRQQSFLAWDARFSTDSDEVIVAVALSNVSEPWEVYTTTASGGALVKLSNHGHSRSDKQFGLSEFIHCTSTDGEVELDAVWNTPINKVKAEGTAVPIKPLPTVVYVHGGPYHRNTMEFDDGFMWPWVQVLLDSGYAVLQPNYRGSCGRGESYAAAVRGAVGGKDYDDVIAMTNHAIELGYADPKRLIISGYSQGGFMSYLSAVRNGMHGHGWKFAGAIPGAGVSDWEVMMRTSDVPSYHAGLVGGTPWGSDKDDSRTRRGSAIWEFKKAADAGMIPPMLLLHGEKDERVPLEQAIGFQRALESRGLPFEMVSYPREGHLFKERKHLVDMAERIVKFTEKCIGKAK